MRKIRCFSLLQLVSRAVPRWVPRAVLRPAPGPILWLILLLPAWPLQAGTLLVFGDSLSAAYGMSPEEGWVHLLQQRINAQGLDHVVINASVSGETTAGGRSRLPALLAEHQPDWLILELGANDGLRGLALQAMESNLAQMIQQAQRQGSRVLLLGMQIPPNYGPAYSRGFARVYADLAKRHRLALVPFFLQDVALDASLMQADQLHPNEDAQPVLLESVWPALAPMLQETGKR